MHIHSYTYVYIQYWHIHAYIQIHTIHTDTYIYIQYVHIHTIRAYTYNTCIYIQYIHLHAILTYADDANNTCTWYLHIHTYTCICIRIHANTTLVRICMYFANTLKKYMQIHTNTCNMNMEKVIRTFWILKKSVCIWYVFVCICTYFCMYLVSICKYCIYLQVSMRLTLFRALNTCKYMQYLQILTWILAYMYTKYMHIRAQYLQIDQVVFACMCMYMHVYASICKYL